MKQRRKFKNLKVEDLYNICNSSECEDCPLRKFNCSYIDKDDLDKVVSYEVKTNKRK